MTATIQMQFSEDPFETIVHHGANAEVYDFDSPLVHVGEVDFAPIIVYRNMMEDAVTTPYILSDSGTTLQPSTNSTESAGSDLVSGGASDHHSYTIIMLTYLFYAVSLATVVHFLIKRLPACIRPPYAVTLFGLGAFLSYMHHTRSAQGWSIFSESIGVMENVNPEIVFFVILPPLLFESGMGLNWHVFRRLLWSAVTLAFPGVLLNLFFIGIFAFVAFGQGWTFPISLLLGSMLSTTDPVAVVAALHSLHAPEKLAILIEGESLLNDGSAIVGVLVFQNMVETGSFSILKIFDLLIRCACGGCLFGIFFAGCQTMFLRLINKLDHAWPELETAVVVGGVYLCYLLSDLMHMSGIISVVALAVSMAVFGKGSYSTEAGHSIHAVVKQLAYFANQLIWLIGGHMTAAQLSQSDVASDPVNWIRMIALYLMLNISRGISTWIMFPTLTRMGYGLNLKETIMLIYAGLRGALCISLALMVRKSHNISTHILNEMGFYVAGSVMLTIVINGSTIEALYKYLKIYPKKTWARIQMQRAIGKIEVRESVFVEALKSHWFFKSANLQIVKQVLPNFSNAEFNTETGQVHIPMDSVRKVMNRILDRFDTHQAEEHWEDKGKSDNGFMYSDLHVQEKEAVLYETKNLSSSSSCDGFGDDYEKIDRLVHVVQLSDTKIKSARIENSNEFENVLKKIVRKSAQESTYFALFQSSKSVVEFATARTDANPFEVPSSGSPSASMEFAVTLPDIGIDPSLLGSNPSIAVGLSFWNSETLLAGLYVATKEIIVENQIKTDEQQSEFRRDFVRGDRITVTIDLPTDPARGVHVSYFCGRYFVGEFALKADHRDLSKLYPTIAFLVAEEQAELSFPLRTTTSAETRTESYAYILNAAICLYEDLFESGTIRAGALRTLNDSVQYGIDAANDDLEVKSMRKRVKDVKKIYTKNRGYEQFNEGEDKERLSPLETEWGFLQLRHSARVDCNTEGISGFFLRLGEFFGIRSQYRKTYRQMEELLAYNVVHSDLIAHSEIARFPETLDLVARLVMISKQYLTVDVKNSSPRDFHIAQHVLAAKLWLQIRRKTLEEFAKEGSLSIHSVHELDQGYISTQLQALDDFVPSRPLRSSVWSVFKPPRVRGVYSPLQTVVVPDKIPVATLPTEDVEFSIE